MASYRSVSSPRSPRGDVELQRAEDGPVALVPLQDHYHGSSSPRAGAHADLRGGYEEPDVLNPDLLMGSSGGGSLLSKEEQEAAGSGAARGGGKGSRWYHCPHLSLRERLLASGGVLSGLLLSLFLWLGLSVRPDSCGGGGPAAGPVDWGSARALTKLQRTSVILVSSDGHRWGYYNKVPTPNIHRLISNGTEAASGMRPVFPSVTFPNHYSIATGLFPAWHGIIENHFSMPAGPEGPGDTFTMADKDPKWWLGEPIWETVVKNGLKAATFFWPGDEVKKGPWDCPVGFCHKYNASIPFEERVDTVLGYIALPDDQRPSLVTLYFEEPDHTGHMKGPDAPEIDTAVARIDAMIGRLLDGLEQQGVSEDVHVILVGDHGMVGRCPQREVYLSEFTPPDLQAEMWSWVEDWSPLLAIRPPEGRDVGQVFDALAGALAEGISTGTVTNGHAISLYQKENLPERLHFQGSNRIQPILGILAEGYLLQWNSTYPPPNRECGGQHGHDNELLSMRTIFVGHGPRFGRGRRVDTFTNVELYAVMCAILGIPPAPNNGSAGFPETLLLKPS